MFSNTQTYGLMVLIIVSGRAGFILSAVLIVVSVIFLDFILVLQAPTVALREENVGVVAAGQIIASSTEVPLNSSYCRGYAK